MVAECMEKHQRMQFFIKGFAEMFILSEVSDGSISGKEVIDSIRGLTDGMWNPSPGAIYPILRRMENEGFIKSSLESGKGRRKISYSITKNGSKRLQQYKKRLLEKSEHMTRTLMPLMLRIMHGSREFEKMKKFMGIVGETRTYILSLPKSRVSAELDRMIAALEKLKVERDGDD